MGQGALTHTNESSGIPGVVQKLVAYNFRISPVARVLSFDCRLIAWVIGQTVGARQGILMAGLHTRMLALIAVALPITASAQRVNDLSETIDVFSAIPVVRPFLENSYGYAVWARIARGGLGFGAATGRGQVYVNGQVTGFSRLVDVSIGFQAGGQVYRQIIFFENQAAYEGFADGSFSFDAQASAIAVTASAQASSSTRGSQASVGAATSTELAGAETYHNGMRVFTMAVGGLMYQAHHRGPALQLPPPYGKQDSNHRQLNQALTLRLHLAAQRPPIEGKRLASDPGVHQPRLQEYVQVIGVITGEIEYVGAHTGGFHPAPATPTPCCRRSPESRIDPPNSHTDTLPMPALPQGPNSRRAGRMANGSRRCRPVADSRTRARVPRRDSRRKPRPDRCHGVCR